MFKHLLFLTFALGLISCNSEILKSNFKFNKQELNCNSNELTTSYNKFKTDTFNFSMSYPSKWDFQNFTDTNNLGSKYKPNYPIPNEWKVTSNDSLYLSKSVMATAWDSTDLSWCHGFQVYTWVQEESLEEIVEWEENNLKTRYQAEILDKGDYSANNINYKWFLFNRTDYDTGLNRALIFYCKKGKAKCYLITVNIVELKGHQDLICKFQPLIETFQFN